MRKTFDTKPHAKKFQLAVSLATLVIATSSGVLRVGADTATEQTRKSIQSVYNKRNADLAKKDTKSYWASRTQNFVWISREGKRKTVKELKPETTRLVNAAESLSGQTVIQEITLKGNTATVQIKDSGTVIIPASKNTKNVIKISEIASDIWVKRNGKWLQSQSKSLSASITVNGKAVK